MNSNELPDMSIDIASLYKEESFTDQKVGVIRRLTPIDDSGEIDSQREILFVGQTQLMTPAGPLPLNFEIPGENLKEAIANFPDAAKAGIEKTMEELREMKRQQSSSILVPDMAGGGVPGSKIQMP